MHKYWLPAIILAFIAFLADAASAADTPFEFSTADEADRYQRLVERLRCLVCQNQSLADSHADLAQDLRDEVYRMISAGESEHAIIDFMVARYGDFVLYQPPLKRSTWLLWASPFLLLAVAVGAAAVVLRQRPTIQHGLSETERAQLTALIDASSDTER